MAGLEVSLRDVTRSNFEAVGGLQLLEHQRQYLAGNSYSLAQLHFYPSFQPRAIYEGEELVGFLMYAPMDEEGKPNEYKIFRFMVDHRHQAKGIGRQALHLALSEIKQKEAAERILICYKTHNPVAQEFYGNFGFVEIGIDEKEDDMIAEIVLPKV